MRFSMALLWLLLPFILGAHNQKIEGFVYNDINKNGQMDAGESGVEGVAVSNEFHVVKTDEKGFYSLDAFHHMAVFITKPAGWDLPLDENNLPQFYYIHQPKGSPPYLDFPGIEPTGTLPKRINFALYKAEDTQQFKALIVGDPQPTDSVEVGYFRDDIVAKMMGLEGAFYMAYGDIAFDNLDIYPQYTQVVSKLGMPAYNVHGNHDVNFKARSDKYSGETFKRWYGPLNYSFNHGQVHFIVLDNVQYHGWNKQENKKGGYTGFLNEKQLGWLKNDLAQVPTNHLIVINTHIPIKSSRSEGKSINTVNRTALFELLKPFQSVLAISAHMHYIEHLELNKSHGWHGPGRFYNINVGAGCGAWWTGPKDARGIPVSYCLDGTPNGFYQFTFTGNRFNYRYIPSKEKADAQLRISSPFGMVNKERLAEQNIVVNIFNADAQTTATAIINGEKKVTLKRVKMSDPFIERYLKQGGNLPGWIGGAVSNSHMFTAPLPASLGKGTHSIKVEAKDSRDNVYKGYTIFNIE